MGGKEIRIEAIKLIGDWCRWMATIEAAAIATIGAFLKLNDGDGEVLSTLFQRCCATSVVCFVASIVLTAWVMVNLPTSVQDIGECESIWDRPAVLLRFHPPLWQVAYLQVLFFLAGICAFAVAATDRVWLSLI